MTASNAPEAARPRTALWKRLLPWLITIVCFSFLYFRIGGAAQNADPPQTVLAYLSGIFASVNWRHWLALMVPYSFLYLLIDTLVLWRVVNWFNTRVAYLDLLPIRASSYIISIVNEQVGKGAIAVYLNRRDGVPGWQIGSSMIFIMFCEFYYLLFWALEGVTLRWDELPEIFHWIPAIAVVALVFFVAFVYYFRSPRFASSTLRERQIFLAFRKAPVWYYLVIIAIRSPALLAAAWVYSEVAKLFGVPLGFGPLPCGGRHDVVDPAPRSRGRDGGVRPRPAQLLRAIQRRHRPGLPAPRQSRAVRSARRAEFLTGPAAR
jgi:hypothetical protein